MVRNLLINFFLNLKNLVKKTDFVGYNQNETEAELQCIIKDEKFSDEILVDKDNIFLVFNKTPFYAESGGQIGDSGKLRLKVVNLFVIF